MTPSRRILFVTKSPPFPHTIGGNQRSALIYQGLSQLGRVDLVLALDRSELPASHLAVLERDYNLVACCAARPAGMRWPWRFVRLLNPSLVDRIAQHLGSVSMSYRPDPKLSGTIASIWRDGKYDIFVGRSMSVFKQAGGDDLHPNAVDVDDWVVDVYQSRLVSPQSSCWERVAARYHLMRAQTPLKTAFEACDLVWFAKGADNHPFGLKSACVLPNIPLFDENAVQTAAERSDPNGTANCAIFMVASFYHKPNVDGMKHFLGRCWPAIHRAVPQSILRIGGVGLSEEQISKWQAIPGVEVPGFVANLAGAYARCAFTIAPIYWGGGTNIKVLESLAHGRTCVVSRFAQRGYEATLRHGESVWAAATDEEMVEGCIALLKDSALCNAMAERGRELVRRHFSLKQLYGVIRDSVEILLGKEQG